MADSSELAACGASERLDGDGQKRYSQEVGSEDRVCRNFARGVAEEKRGLSSRQPRKDKRTAG